MGFDMEADILGRPWIKRPFEGLHLSEVSRSSRGPLVGMALESALISGGCNKVDRFAIGAFLFQMYSRPRVSEAPLTLMSLVVMVFWMLVLSITRRSAGVLGLAHYLVGFNLLSGHCGLPGLDLAITTQEPANW